MHLYINDFIVVGAPMSASLNILLETRGVLSIPVAGHKCMGPSLLGYPY